MLIGVVEELSGLPVSSGQIFLHADILLHHLTGSKTDMNSRFKSNNLVAILIAVILFATGFALYFIHRQSESKQEQDKAPTAFISENLKPVEYLPTREFPGELI